ncbi:MAG: hypothetical protein JSV23_09695 [Promethearchaeota archaeon]|nr:MAG: hypothetical protein JSV23_09695 [Candidatus Lokiarchaeota archaeon]
MSDTGINKDNLELKVDIDSLNKMNKNYSDLQEKYGKLKNDNQILSNENKILKSLILENSNNKIQGALIKGGELNFGHKNTKGGKIFYIQIFLGIFVIVLILGFHILYLSVTSCLTYSEGNPFCWVANWLGIDIHASFYIDFLLYSLIAIQIVLIILIIRNKLNERY